MKSIKYKRLKKVFVNRIGPNWDVDLIHILNGITRNFVTNAGYLITLMLKQSRPRHNELNHSVETFVVWNIIYANLGSTL
jgi:hypothetical protein